MQAVVVPLAVALTPALPELRVHFALPLKAAPGKLKEGTLERGALWLETSDEKSDRFSEG